MTLCFLWSQHIDWRAAMYDKWISLTSSIVANVWLFASQRLEVESFSSDLEPHNYMLSAVFFWMNSLLTQFDKWSVGVAFCCWRQTCSEDLWRHVWLVIYAMPIMPLLWMSLSLDCTSNSVLSTSNNYATADLRQIMTVLVCRCSVALVDTSRILFGNFLVCWCWRTRRFAVVYVYHLQTKRWLWNRGDVKCWYTQALSLWLHAKVAR